MRQFEPLDEKFVEKVKLLVVGDFCHFTLSSSMYVIWRVHNGFVVKAQHNIIFSPIFKKISLTTIRQAVGELIADEVHSS